MRAVKPTQPSISMVRTSGRDPQSPGGWPDRLAGKSSGCGSGYGGIPGLIFSALLGRRVRTRGRRELVSVITNSLGRRGTPRTGVFVASLFYVLTKVGLSASERRYRIRKAAVGRPAAARLRAPSTPYGGAGAAIGVADGAATATADDERTVSRRYACRAAGERDAAAIPASGGCRRSAPQQRTSARGVRRR